MIDEMLSKKGIVEILVALYDAQKEGKRLIQKDLMVVGGVSQSIITTRLNELKYRGIVDIDIEGASYVYHLTEKGVQLAQIVLKISELYNQADGIINS